MSPFWQSLGLQKWIPQLTAIDLRIAVLLCWLFAILLVAWWLYPKNPETTSGKELPAA
jgi:hypothetical protein